MSSGILRGMAAVAAVAVLCAGAARATDALEWLPPSAPIDGVSLPCASGSATSAEMPSLFHEAFGPSTPLRSDYAAGGYAYTVTEAFEPADGFGEECDCAPGTLVRTHTVTGPGEMAPPVVQEVEIQGRGPVFVSPPPAELHAEFEELMALVEEEPQADAQAYESGEPVLSVFELYSAEEMLDGSFRLYRRWTATGDCGRTAVTLQTVVVSPEPACGENECSHMGADEGTGNRCEPRAEDRTDWECTCNADERYVAVSEGRACALDPTYAQCPKPRVCREINFDSFLTGTKINRQFARLGVWVAAEGDGDDDDDVRAVTFDTASPAAGEERLGSPGAAAGGPGAGAGGDGTNTAPLRGVLIVRGPLGDDDDRREPVPLGSGGALVFTFARPMTVASLGLLNALEGGVTVLARRGDGAALEELYAGAAAGEAAANGYAALDLAADGVTELRVELGGAGAVTHLVACEGDPDAAQVVDFTDGGPDAAAPLQVRPPSANTYGEFASAFHPDQVSWRDTAVEGGLATEVCFTLSSERCAAEDGGDALGGRRAPSAMTTRYPFSPPNGTDPECSYYNAASGEVWSDEPFRFGTIRFTARPEPRAGVVSSVFTFHGLGPPQETAHQLIFSFVGEATTRVVTSVKTWPVGGEPDDRAQTLDIPFDWSEGEHTYSIVWTADMVEWWAEDTLLRRVVGSSQEPVPQEAGRVMAHSWAASLNDQAYSVRSLAGEYDWSDTSEHTFCVHCLQFVRDAPPPECEARGADGQGGDGDGEEEEEECPSALYGTHAPDLIAQYSRDSGALTLEAYSAYHPEAQLLLMITSDPEGAAEAMCDCNARSVADSACYASVPLDSLTCDFSDLGPPTADDECAIGSPSHPQLNFLSSWYAVPEGRCGLRAQLSVPFDTLVGQCGSVLESRPAGNAARPAVRFSGHFFAAVVTPKPYGPLEVQGVPRTSSEHVCQLYDGEGPMADVTASGGCGGNPSLVHTSERIGSCVSNYTDRHCWTATDGCGDTVTECSEVVVFDLIEPVVKPSDLPAEVRVQCGDAVPVATNAAGVAVYAEDNCNPYVNLVVVEDPPAAQREACQDYTRTYSAVDSCGFVTDEDKRVTQQVTFFDPPGVRKVRGAAAAAAAAAATNTATAEGSAPWRGLVGSRTVRDIRRYQSPAPVREELPARREVRPMTDINCGCGCEKVNLYPQSVYFEFDVAYAVATELLEKGGGGDEGEGGETRKDAAAASLDATVELQAGKPVIVLTPAAGSAAVASVELQGGGMAASRRGDAFVFASTEEHAGSRHTFRVVTEAGDEYVLQASVSVEGEAVAGLDDSSGGGSSSSSSPNTPGEFPVVVAAGIAIAFVAAVAAGVAVFVARARAQRCRDEERATGGAAGAAERASALRRSSSSAADAAGDADLDDLEMEPTFFGDLEDVAEAYGGLGGGA